MHADGTAIDLLERHGAGGGAHDLDAAAKIIEGSARAMGLEVVEG